MILLTGATGKTGMVAAAKIAAAGKKARVVTRDAARATKLAEMGHEIAVGDAADGAFMKEAMRGIKRAFLLLANTQNQGDMEAQFTDIAKAAGVRHIVKISSIEAHAGIGAKVPEMHATSEAYIKASGVAWTMVKPNFYMQTLLAAAKGIQARGELTMPIGKTRISMIDCRDSGEIVAKTLLESGHEGQSYKLTGPEAVSFDDVAKRMTAILGKEVKYVDPPLPAYRENLLKALPDPWRVDSVCEIFAMTAKGPEIISSITDTVQKLLGRAPGGLDKFIGDYKAAFA
ncbi:MAG: NmrA family NAD(P)-binding protein [Rhodospirillaceae bacterium]|nr:NmrA family NAD(P)-binding protein [Rhodospirillaceae bacterium]